MKPYKSSKGAFSIQFKLTALIVCLGMVVSDIAIAAPLVNAPAPTHFSIPKEMASIELTHQGSSGRSIIYIEDAHDSLEAQERIADVINHLVSGYGVQTVFEEGYEGPLPTDDYFAHVSDKEKKQKLAYFFLDKLRLGGAEYAHINRKHDFNLVGVDDRVLHAANIAAYGEAAKVKIKTEKDLNRLLNALKKISLKNFPAEVKTWLKERKRFNAGSLELIHYLKRTRSLLGEHYRSENYPLIDLLLNIRFVPGEQLEEEALKINPHALFTEMDRLENYVAEAFIQNPTDLKTFHYLKNLEMLIRLNEIEVTAGEFDALAGVLQATRTQDIARFIARESQKPISLSKQWEKNIQKAVHFYALARARDARTEELLKTYSAKDGHALSVLVFGGFHKSKMHTLLKRLGYTIYTVTPRITHMSETHQAYYKQIMGEGRHNFEIPLFVKGAAKPLDIIDLKEYTPDTLRRLADNPAIDWSLEPSLLHPQIEAALTARSEARAAKLDENVIRALVESLNLTEPLYVGAWRGEFAVSPASESPSGRIDSELALVRSKLEEKYKQYRYQIHDNRRTGDRDDIRLEIKPRSETRSEVFNKTAQDLVARMHELRFNWNRTNASTQEERELYFKADESEYNQWVSEAGGAPLNASLHFLVFPTEEEIEKFPDLRALSIPDADWLNTNGYMGVISGDFFFNEAGEPSFLASIIQTGTHWHRLPRSVKARYDAPRGSSRQEAGYLNSWYGEALQVLRGELQKVGVTNFYVLSDEGIKEIRDLSKVAINDNITAKMYGKPALSFEKERIELTDDATRHRLLVWAPRSEVREGLEDPFEKIHEAFKTQMQHRNLSGASVLLTQLWDAFDNFPETHPKKRGLAVELVIAYNFYLSAILRRKSSADLNEVMKRLESPLRIFDLYKESTPKMRFQARFLVSNLNHLASQLIYRRGENDLQQAGDYIRRARELFIAYENRTTNMAGQAGYLISIANNYATVLSRRAKDRDLVTALEALQATDEIFDRYKQSDPNMQKQAIYRVRVYLTWLESSIQAGSTLSETEKSFERLKSLVREFAHVITHAETQRYDGVQEAVGLTQAAVFSPEPSAAEETYDLAQELGQIAAKLTKKLKRLNKTDAVNAFVAENSDDIKRLREAESPGKAVRTFLSLLASKQIKDKAKQAEEVTTRAKVEEVPEPPAVKTKNTEASKAQAAEAHPIKKKKQTGSIDSRMNELKAMLNDELTPQHQIRTAYDVVVPKLVKRGTAKAEHINTVKRAAKYLGVEPPELKSRSELREEIIKGITQLQEKDEKVASILSKRLQLTADNDEDALRYMLEDVQFFLTAEKPYYNFNEEPKVSVVILHYKKDEEDTLNLMQNISTWDYENFDILLVDNASPDHFSDRYDAEIANRIPENLRDKIRLITNRVNLGYAGGNNQAFREAIRSGSDYAFHVNNDAVLEKDGLSKMIEAIKKRPEVGAAQPNLALYSEDEDVRSVIATGLMPAAMRRSAVERAANFVAGLEQNGLVQPVSGADNLYYKEPTMLGTAQLVRSDMIRLSGGFDTRYHTFGDEDNIGYRYWMTGLKKAIVNDVFLVHPLFESPNNFRSQFLIWRNHMLTAYAYFNLDAIGESIASNALSPHYSFFKPEQDKVLENLDRFLGGTDLEFMAIFKGISDGILGHFSPTYERSDTVENVEIENYFNEFRQMQEAKDLLLRLFNETDAERTRLMIYALHIHRNEINFEKPLSDKLKKTLRAVLLDSIAAWREAVRTQASNAAFNAIRASFVEKVRSEQRTPEEDFISFNELEEIFGASFTRMPLEVSDDGFDLMNVVLAGEIMGTLLDENVPYVFKRPGFFKEGFERVIKVAHDEEHLRDSYQGAFNAGGVRLIGYNERLFSEAMAYRELQRGGHIEGLPEFKNIGVLADGRLWIDSVMLKDSKSLKEKIASEGSIELTDLWNGFIQIAHLLKRIHSEKGYLHNDIKPDNILMNDKGEVQLIDFDIAVAVGELSEGAGSEGYKPADKIRREDSDVFSFLKTIIKLVKKNIEASTDIVDQHILRESIPVYEQWAKGKRSARPGLDRLLDQLYSDARALNIEIHPELKPEERSELRVSENVFYELVESPQRKGTLALPVAALGELTDEMRGELLTAISNRREMRLVLYNDSHDFDAETVKWRDQFTSLANVVAVIEDRNEALQTWGLSESVAVDLLTEDVLPNTNFIPGARIKKLKHVRIKELGDVLLAKLIATVPEDQIWWVREAESGVMEMLPGFRSQLASYIAEQAIAWSA